MSARAQCEETVRGLPSFLLRRLRLEPRLVCALLLFLAPSSCNIKRRRVIPTESLCAHAVSAVCDVIQQRSVFVKEWFKKQQGP